MGLELDGIIVDVRESHEDVSSALWIGALAALAVVAIRAVYVAPLLLALRRRAERNAVFRDRLTTMQTDLEAGEVPGRTGHREPRNEREAEHLQRHTERRTEIWRTRIRRGIADVDYLAAAPMGWQEGTVLVWAGMRGVVTLAAAQTLPGDTPQRSLLILIAFVVAAGTLVVQGGTLPWLVTRLGVGGPAVAGPDPDRLPLLQELSGTAGQVLDDPALARPDGTTYDPTVVARVRRQTVLPTDVEELVVARDREDEYRELRLTVITSMRETLLAARKDGMYASATLENALDVLDADQISTELRVQRPGDEPD